MGRPNYNNFKSGVLRSQRLAEARKKGTHTAVEWESIKFFFNNKCVKCGGAKGYNSVEKDHIIPIYQGGSDSIKNLQPLCAGCNGSKGPERVDYRKIVLAKYGVKLPAKWDPVVK